MIAQATHQKIYDAAMADIGQYYFVAHQLLKDAGVFIQVLFSSDEQLILLFRRSGTLHIVVKGSCIDDANACWLQKQLEQNQWKQIVCTRLAFMSIVSRMPSLSFRKGSFIAKCSPLDWNDSEAIWQTRTLSDADLSNTVSLYKEVFKGFPSQAYMSEKLKHKRGRGVCVQEDDTLLSVAQSDFETEHCAIVVGVATAPAMQGRGLGKACMLDLCRQLMHEGKTVFLIYENLIAGKLYDHLGFKVYDRLYHIERR